MSTKSLLFRASLPSLILLHSNNHVSPGSFHPIWRSASRIQLILPPAYRVSLSACSTHASDLHGHFDGMFLPPRCIRDPHCEKDVCSWVAAPLLMQTLVVSEVSNDSQLHGKQRILQSL